MTVDKIIYNRGWQLMDSIYSIILAWSIKHLVNRQKTYQARCSKLNNIINGLVDVYCDYTKGCSNESKDDN